VKYAQHDEAVCVNAIAKNILGAQHYEHELSVAPICAEWMPELGALLQDTRLGEDFLGDDCGEPRMAAMQESSETVEVGKSDRRPFQSH